MHVYIYIYIYAAWNAVLHYHTAPRFIMVQRITSKVQQRITLQCATPRAHGTLLLPVPLRSGLLLQTCKTRTPLWSQACLRHATTTRAEIQGTPTRDPRSWKVRSFRTLEERGRIWEREREKEREREREQNGSGGGSREGVLLFLLGLYIWGWALRGSDSALCMPGLEQSTWLTNNWTIQIESAVNNVLILYWSRPPFSSACSAPCWAMPQRLESAALVSALWRNSRFCTAVCCVAMRCDAMWYAWATLQTHSRHAPDTCLSTLLSAETWQKQQLVIKKDPLCNPWRMWCNVLVL